jgi:ABC-type transport system involved in multi-copper enzyme maturation permease subunit
MAGFILFIGLILAFCSIPFFIYQKHYRINILDENCMEQIKKCNYALLEVKRIRIIGKMNIRKEYPLEASIPSPVFSPNSDRIEVFGVKELNDKNKIFQMYWSMENAKKVKTIINKINEELKSKKVIY